MSDSMYQGTNYVPKPIPIVKRESMPLTYKIILWVLVLVVIALIILICILWDKVDDTKSTIKEINAPSYTLMQEDLDKKLVFTASSDTTVTVPENISGWAGNLIIQPKYEPVPPTAFPHSPQPYQINLIIKPAHDLFLTELHNGTHSYDEMPINGKVYLESNPASSSPATLSLMTYYLNMGFINNKVYIQSLAGIRVT